MANHWINQNQSVAPTLEKVERHSGQIRAVHVSRSPDGVKVERELQLLWDVLRVENVFRVSLVLAAHQKVVFVSAPSVSPSN